MAKKTINKNGKTLKVMKDNYYGFSIYVGEQNFVERYYEIYNIDDELVNRGIRTIISSENDLEQEAVKYINKNLLRHKRGFNGFVSYNITCFVKKKDADVVVKSNMFDVIVSEFNCISGIDIIVRRSVRMKILVDGKKMEGLNTIGIIGKESNIEYVSPSYDRCIEGKKLVISYKPDKNVRDVQPVTISNIVKSKPLPEIKNSRKW